MPCSTLEHSPFLSTGSGLKRPAMVLPNSHTWLLCLAQALSWCKTVQPTQSAMPPGSCPSRAWLTAVIPRPLPGALLGEGATQCAIYHRECHPVCHLSAGMPPKVPFITWNAIQSAVYHTKDLPRSSVCLFAAGQAVRQAGPWSIVSSLWNNARAYPGPLIGQANLVPENPNNAANLQRKIKQRGFCFLSSSALLSTGEDLGFGRSPGYSFHAGAEP